MKKILGLFVGLAITAFTYAQEPGITFTDASASYDPAATTVFNFEFTGATSENITEASTYYTDYFTVEATEVDGNHNVVVTLVEDNEMARKVIGRFLATATSHKTPIMANGTAYPVNEFVNEWTVVSTE
jgi:hypothetical protein